MEETELHIPNVWPTLTKIDGFNASWSQTLRESQTSSLTSGAAGSGLVVWIGGLRPRCLGFIVGTRPLLLKALIGRGI